VDPNRFDALTRSLHSRRRVVQTLAGLGAGLGLARTVGAAAKKSVGAGAKKGGGSRFGCTKHDNTCAAGSTIDVPCPDAPVDSDAFCVKNNKGKPLCAAEGACLQCKRNSDCAAAGPTAVCIKKCPACQAQGAKSACVVPLTADMVP
jgi:hypothetical protein